MKLEPFSNLDENLEELNLDGKIRKFFKLVKEEGRKDDANECTLLRCPECEGLLVQMPEHLPLKVKCMECEGQFALKNVINL